MIDIRARESRVSPGFGVSGPPASRSKRLDDRRRTPRRRPLQDVSVSERAAWAVGPDRSRWSSPTTSGSEHPAGPLAFAASRTVDRGQMLADR
jgi:hypothetical protein